MPCHLSRNHVDRGSGVRWPNKHVLHVLSFPTLYVCAMNMVWRIGWLWYELVKSYRNWPTTRWNRWYL